MSAVFSSVDNDAIVRLIVDYPLAWLMSDYDPFAATPMPLLVETDENGAPRVLVGHLPRAHPLVAAFTANSCGSFLFNGPQGYITPEWIANKNWAPTWNFAVVAIRGEVTFDEGLTARALAQLVDHMEADRTSPWTSAEMGGRYTQLEGQVIGFRIAVQSCKARFKLGQDESNANFDAITTGLGNTELARLMTAMRPDQPATG